MLNRRELLHRGEDPSDRRSKILSMTPAGTEFMARASAKRDRILLETIETNAPRFVVNAMLKAMDGVNAYQNKSSDLLQRMAVDPEAVDAHDVTIAMAEANLSLNIARTVMDRVVRGWKEVINTR